MRQRDLREHVFKLLFMTEFNTQEEMPEQLSMYLEGIEEVSGEAQEKIQEKYRQVL